MDSLFPILVIMQNYPFCCSNGPRFVYSPLGLLLCPCDICPFFSFIFLLSGAVGYLRSTLHFSVPAPKSPGALVPLLESNFWVWYVLMATEVCLLLGPLRRQS